MQITINLPDGIQLPETDLRTELAIESGQLTAVIVKGSGKANLEITLEWERSDKVQS